MFTEALLRHIGTPNLSINNLMVRVTKDVKAMTGNAQEPWTSGSLEVTIAMRYLAPLTLDRQIISYYIRYR